MKVEIHRAETRGGGDYGWLKPKYSFSFANWYEPTRMGFGALRVLNDDWIAPKSGFGEHTHDNFEIITIVRSGAVTHKDSMGNIKKVSAGEVQVMSAGTGVRHAELNSEDEPLELFQIWIETRTRNIAPYYDQKSFEVGDRKNKWQVMVSDGTVPGSLRIEADARVALADIGSEKKLVYCMNDMSHGVYVMVIEGAVNVSGVKLVERDAVGISDTDSIDIVTESGATVLLVDVSMS